MRLKDSVNNSQQ